MLSVLQTFRTLTGAGGGAGVSNFTGFGGGGAGVLTSNRAFMLRHGAV